MRNILLTAGLSTATFFFVLSYLESQENTEIRHTLPAVEIKAKSIPRDTLKTLPEKPVRGRKVKFT